MSAGRRAAFHSRQFAARMETRPTVGGNSCVHTDYSQQLPFGVTRHILAAMAERTLRDYTPYVKYARQQQALRMEQAAARRERAWLFGPPHSPVPPRNDST